MAGVRRRAGMTMIEVVVMAAIVATMTAIIVGGFPIYNDQAYVKRESERIALDMRRAQSYALTGKVAPIASSTPNYWGMHIAMSSPASYVIFARFGSSTLPYDPATDEVYSTSVLEQGITMQGLSTAVTAVADEVNLYFSVPYGELEVSDNNGSGGSSGTMTLQSKKKNYTKKINAQVSGNVVITN